MAQNLSYQSSCTANRPLRVLSWRSCCTLGGKVASLMTERWIEAAIEIDAPPSRVWTLLTDFPRMPAWNPFIKSISGNLTQGARLSVYCTTRQVRDAIQTYSIVRSTRTGVAMVGTYTLLRNFRWGALFSARTRRGAPNQAKAG